MGQIIWGGLGYTCRCYKKMDAKLQAELDQLIQELRSMFFKQVNIFYYSNSVVLHSIIQLQVINAANQVTNMLL